jgi:hypothetical protein
MKIKTSNICPPIPDRRYDWCAWDDSRGEDSSPYGYGRTEEEAVAELKERLESEAEAKFLRVADGYRAEITREARP